MSWWWLGLAWASDQDFQTARNDHLELKWFRDSVEHQALSTQIFGHALASVEAQRRELGRRDAWAVVVDIDETVLDNSPYFLELAAYGRSFDWPSWDAWCERRTAEALPGAQAFVDGVRAAGGRVVWISNRHIRTEASTRDNLRAVGLWSDSDGLCLMTDDEARTKRVRREEVREGRGSCGVEGQPARVLAYVGDTWGDLPQDDEDGGNQAQLGVRTFVLPNPLYGGWEHTVTRPDLRP
jgi:5'-nucleotidase (lipoprotein e(P4) family)